MKWSSQTVLIFVLAAALVASLSWRWAGSDPAAKASPVTAEARSTKHPGTAKSPAFPVPKIQSSAEPSPASAEPAVNPLLDPILKEGGATLTVERLAKYLAQNQRNAESLVTAAQLTNDLALLREAVARFPNDPRAQLELALRSTDPKERERALEALRAADPNNAMGSYLSAAKAFKEGRSDDAVKMLSEAMQRGSLDDYAMANIVSAEEAYLSAGFTPLQAKAAAMMTAAMPQATELNALSRDMDSLRKAYAEAGDAASAQSMTEMGIDAGQRIQQSLGSRILLNDLIGMSVEQRFLKTLDPAAVLANSGLTVEQRLNQIAERKNLIKDTMHGVDPTAANVDPQLLLQFLDRQKALGELAALQWLRGRLGTGQ